MTGSPGPEASRSEAEVSMHEGLGKGVYGGKAEKGKYMPQGSPCAHGQGGVKSRTREQWLQES